MASLSNINGLFDVHSTGAILFSTSHGTSGQILRSNGDAAPTWVAASTVIGGPYLPLTGGTLTGATATDTGISLTVGGNLFVTGTSTLTGALSGSTGAFSGAVTITDSTVPLVLNNLGGQFTQISIQNNGTQNAALWLDETNDEFVMYANTGKSIEFHTNGSATPKMKILSNGYVGIGTSTPTSKLHIVSDEVVLGSVISDYRDLGVQLATSQETGNSGTGISFDHGALGAAITSARATTTTWGTDLRFYTHPNATTNQRNVTERMRINSEGNVGIGTDSPDAKLAIGPEDTTNELRFLVDNDGPGVLGVYNDGQAANYNQVDNGYVLQVGTRGGAGNFKSIEARGECILASTTGNVGIGTSSPNHPLEVNGFISTNSSSSGSGLLIRKNSSTTAFIGQSGGWEGNTTTNLAIAAETGGDIRLYTNGSGSLKVIIDTSGNVGIGTTSPYAQLHVSHSLGNGGIMLGNTATTGSKEMLLNIHPLGLIWQRWVNGAYQANLMTLDYDGNLGIGATDPVKKLDVRGQLAISNSASSYWYLDRNDSTGYFEIFDDGNTNRLTIDTSGNVGIGVTGPSEKLHVNGNIAINDRIIGNSKNYATSQGWLPGAAGTFSSQIGYYGGNFSINGPAAENSLIWGLSAFGNRALQWQTIGEAGNNADGGWNKSIDNLPDGNTHAYMSYVYVKRTSSATTGTFYYGCQQVLDLAGNVNGNPYFHAINIGSLPQDIWCVAVGIIQAYTDTNTATPTINGIYRVDTGARVATGTSFKSQSGVQTTQSHRTYHYYSTNPAATLAFANPGFYVIDGTEPRLNTLVS